MHIIQLNPPIPLNTPKGIGVAWLVLDYGPEYNLLWTVAIDQTGEVWTFDNTEVRAVKNTSMGRPLNNMTPFQEKASPPESTVTK